MKDILSFLLKSLLTIKTKVMKDKLKCKVVMLPTEKAIESAVLAKYSSLTDNFNMIGSKNKLISWPTYKLLHQHLYFLAQPTEEQRKMGIGVVKKDTLFLTNRTLPVFQLFSDSLPEGELIVATTDPDLGLSLIPTSFVEKYVEKQGKIDEVMIEMEDNQCDGCLSVQIIKDGIHGNNESCCTAHLCNKPKTRKDNTVICSPVKDSWTREEVEILCRKALEKYAFSSMSQLPYNVEEFEEQADKWIEENL